MNKANKGRLTEKAVSEILKRQGHITVLAPKTSKRIFSNNKVFFVSQKNDFFGLFDIIAKHSVKRNNLWIQVKSTLPDVSEAKTKIEIFYKIYCNKYESCQIWLKVLRKGFVVYDYDSKKWIKTYYNLKGEATTQFKITK